MSSYKLTTSPPKGNCTNTKFVRFFFLWESFGVVIVFLMTKSLKSVKLKMEEITMKQKFYKPKFLQEAFTCPYCGVYAHQHWGHLYGDVPDMKIKDFRYCFCGHCYNYSIWLKERMVYPLETYLPDPNDDLSDEIKNIYNEARSVYLLSPKSACALLRLVIQELCIELGEKGEKLNDDIGNLVKKGLPQKVQQSLDIVRVIGNNAVHPGEINIDDNLDIAESLFNLVNLISDKMISEPKQLNDLYTKLPEGKRKEIEKRDNKN